MSENAVLAALRRMGYTKDEMTGHGFRSALGISVNPTCDAKCGESQPRAAVTKSQQTSRLALRRFLTGALLLFLSCSPTRGCVESNFVLAPESRLPTWLKVPTGLSRADITVELFYYTGVGSNDARFVVFTADHQKLSERDAKQWWHPRTQKQLDTYYSTEPRPAFPEPAYVVVDADGQIDVIEHRSSQQNARDPTIALFWMADNPEILKEAKDSVRFRP